MATALEGTTVTYEELAAIEQSFDEAEVEISMYCPIHISSQYTNHILRVFL